MGQTVNGKYVGVEKFIFADVYNFMTRNLNTSGSDIEWNRIVTEARALGEKYDSSPLAVDMIVSACTQIEYACGQISSDSKRFVKPYKVWESELLTKLNSCR